MASQIDIASAFLRELHAPDNTAMRLAVVAWMRAESGNTVRANNPWNMTLGAAKETGIKTCGSWKSQSSGLVFAQFCSPQDGARASARLLLNAGHDWRKYDTIVAAARAGKPVSFLQALAASAWDAGRYGTKNGGRNKLLAIYAGMGGAVPKSALNDIAPNEVGPAPYTGGNSEGLNSPLARPLSQIGSGSLGGWGDHVVFPVGHTLTAADVDYIMATLAQLGYFKDDTTGSAQSVTRAILNSHIGQPWDKSMQDALQKEFFAAADNAIPKPLDAIGSLGGAVIQILGALFDPRKWLLVLALIAGAGLTAYGGKNVLAAAR